MPKIVPDEQIYRATIEMIVNRGYANATTKQIAEAAGISEVTMFRKYGNKAQLVKQALNSLVEQIDFESAVQYTGDVKTDLLRVAHMYQGSAEENGIFFYSMLLEVSRSQEIAELVNTPLGMIHSVGKLMARYQAEGVLRQEHPLHAVAGLLGPLIATNIIRSTQVIVPFSPIDLTHHVTLFLNGRRL